MEKLLVALGLDRKHREKVHRYMRLPIAVLAIVFFVLSVSQLYFVASEYGLSEIFGGSEESVNARNGLFCSLFLGVIWCLLYVRNNLKN